MLWSDASRARALIARQAGHPAEASTGRSAVASVGPLLARPQAPYNTARSRKDNVAKVIDRDMKLAMRQGWGQRRDAAPSPPAGGPSSAARDRWPTHAAVSGILDCCCATASTHQALTLPLNAGALLLLVGLSVELGDRVGRADERGV